jgi:photosystem II stability/assembly factor-like uncharacterized protein
MRRVTLGSLLASAVVFAVFVSIGSAAVTVSQSGWSWGNPTPQGNTLSSMDFVQGRGYAAGDAGTALRTDDAGATWAGLATGTSADLSRLQVIDPDTLVVLGGAGCVLRRSDDGGKTFHKVFVVAEQNCPAPVQAFTFVDRQIGYLLLADGAVLRTSDSGQTFSRQTAVPGTQASNNSTGSHGVDLAFTGPDTGFVFVSPPGGAPSIAFATTDGGVSWKPVPGIDRGSVRRIYLFDAQNAYAVGPDTMLKSADGGKTWKDQPAGNGHDLTSIRCADVDTCLLTTAKGDLLVRTTDGGKTATDITASSQPIFAAAYASPQRVAAVGTSGATVVSDDGGINYTQISRDLGGVYFGLRGGTAASSAFALGARGALAVTMDGGGSWKTLAVPTSADVLDVSFFAADTGYALDVRGGLFKTTNSGVTWQTLDTGSTTAPRALKALGGDAVLLAGPRGIRRAVGGGRFDPVGGKPVTKAVLTSLKSGTGVVVAFGNGTKNVFLSTDQGKAWTKVKLPKKTTVTDAGFVTRRVGFVLDGRGRLLKSADGGKSWTDLIGTGTSDANALTMATATQGFLNVQVFGNDFTPGHTAVVMRTSDGGRTWRPQSIARGDAKSVVTTAGLQAYALVGNNHLFFTSSGGDAGTPSKLTVQTPARAFTKKALKKARGRVNVTGTLAGAVGGEQIVVSHRDLASGMWVHQVVTAGANGGSFTTSWTIRRSGVFVAQWAGDSGRNGAGSAPLVITVR